MSRFDRLEFETPAAAKPRQQTSSAGVPQPAEPASHGELNEKHWLKKAIEERQKGDHENALRLYSRALEWDKTLVGGWVGQVQMLVAMQEYPEAELWSRKALELFKNNSELLAGRAQALCRIGDLTQAQAVSDLSLNQQGQSAYPWIVRGELLLARKQKNEAYCFDKAKQAANDFLTLLDIAAVYEHTRRYSQALTWARQATELAPAQGYCWFCQGKYEAALGLNKPAAISFERCRQLVPNHVEARRLLDEVKRGKGTIGGWLMGWFR